MAAQEIELQIKKGQQVIIKEVPFSHYFSDWIELYKSSKHKTTYDRYQNSFERVKNYFKDMPIQKISRSDYQQFFKCIWKRQVKGNRT